MTPGDWSNHVGLHANTGSREAMQGKGTDTWPRGSRADGTEPSRPRGRACGPGGWHQRSVWAESGTARGEIGARSGRQPVGRRGTGAGLFPGVDVPVSLPPFCFCINVEAIRMTFKECWVSYTPRDMDVTVSYRSRGAARRPRCSEHFV